MSDPTYPNLGFNPVPGVPDDVGATHRAIASAVSSLQEAGGQLDNIRNSDDPVWQGEAAQAFRSHLNESLVADLSHAQASLSEATGVLSEWQTALVNNKEAAQRLDEQAGAAMGQYKRAEAQLASAQSNPDLRLAGQYFPNVDQLRQAQTRLDVAEGQVRDAATRVDTARSAYDAIIRQAKELEDEHARTARRAADRLKDATRHLAPKKPGLLSRLGKSFNDAVGAVVDWVKDHLDDIHAVLSTISAVAGLVALLTPPPIDAIALGVSVVAGAGALACDLADPKFRHQISRLCHGEFDGESLGAVVTGVTDVLSVVPGVGVAAKALKGADAAVEGATGVARVTELASAAAHDPGIPAKLISKIPGVGKAMEATKLIEQGASASIMVTQNMANILWKTKGAVSNVYNDVKMAVPE